MTQTPTCPKCGGHWFARDEDGDPICRICGWCGGEVPKPEPVKTGKERRAR